MVAQFPNSAHKNLDGVFTRESKYKHNYTQARLHVYTYVHLHNYTKTQSPNNSRTVG